MLPEIFEDSVWQMSLGERAAVEGTLAQLKPRLAIEIGSMEGACLRRIALHAEEAHSFDLDPPTLPMPDNVVLHTGDSHELLPRFLEELADQGRNVDFVIVDGDHTSQGVRRDLEDLLDSSAVAHTIILIHDSANPQVRSGLDAVRFSAWPKVACVDLDWIPGRLFAEREIRNELWYGLALVAVDAAQPAYLSGSVFEQRYHPSGPLLSQMRELVVTRERFPGSGARERDVGWFRSQLLDLMGELSAVRMREVEIEAQLRAVSARVEEAEQRRTRAERTLEDVKSSASWKLTEPLRVAKQRAARRLG